MKLLTVDLVVFGGVGYLIGDITGLVVGLMISSLAFVILNTK